MAQAWIGCSGFNYPHWKGVFYLDHLPQKKWLAHYCTVFSTVELNVTFYRLPSESTFDKWHQETPKDFRFSLKGSRYITHVRRLLDPDGPVELFFNGALRLKEKLTAVLWQFPPSFKIDLGRLVRFLALLKNYPVRNTLEFRNETWITKGVEEVCREYNVSLCMADWPEFIDELPVTSDFVYVRRHGEGGRYDSCYSAADLKKDARRIRGYLKHGSDVYIYFNNDAAGCAPANAKELKDLLN